MSRRLTRLIYCSRSLLDPTAVDVPAEIRRILAASRRNNADDGVTGALLFTAGCFAQALEGPLATVERTFERIQRDPRHHDTTVLAIEPIGERAFGSWTMGYGGEAGPLAQMALDRAFARPEDGHGGEVYGILRDVMAREREWA